MGRKYRRRLPYGAVLTRSGSNTLTYRLGAKVYIRWHGPPTSTMYAGKAT